MFAPVLPVAVFVESLTLGRLRFRRPSLGGGPVYLLNARVLRRLPSRVTARYESSDLQDNGGMAASDGGVQLTPNVLYQSADGYLDVVGSADGDGDLYSGYAAPASATVTGGGHGDLYSVPFAAPAPNAADGSDLYSGYADPTPTEDGGDVYSGYATPAPTVSFARTRGHARGNRMHPNSPTHLVHEVGPDSMFVMPCSVGLEANQTLGLYRLGRLSQGALVLRAGVTYAVPVQDDDGVHQSVSDTNFLEF